MNKFIVIGHGSSYFLDVEHLLQQYGVSPANKSKREQFTPVEITNILRKVISEQNSSIKNKVTASPFSNNYNRKGKKRSKKGKKNSHLLVSSAKNTEISTINPIWNGLFLDLMLSNLDQELWGWSDSYVIDVLNYWADVDPSIKFIFIYDHPSNIFLHSSLEQALSLDSNVIEEKLHDWQQYNQKVLSLFEQYQSRSVLLCGQQVLDSVNVSLEKVASTLSAPLYLGERRDILDIDDKIDSINSSALERVIVDNILKQHESILNLYTELQAKATLPHLSLYDSAVTENSQYLLKAWKELIEQKSELVESQEVIAKSRNKILKLKEAESEFKIRKIELEQQRKQLQDNLSNSEKNTQKISERLKESQIEIAKIEIEKKKISDELNQVKEKSESLEKELSEDNKELLNQVHILQRELETYFLENQKLKQKPALFGATERVKQQLNYQLGSKMIENSRSLSGWLKMPFSLSKIQHEYQMYEKYNKLQKNLPKLEDYQDFLQSEKVKKHLSYQLGDLYLKNNILGFLCKLPKLVKEFRKNKKDD
ncbi:hypothetical protein [Avibacterium paragallinarum]|nr:hypothetical protein [Avibacterium paragallinarum]KAA6208740.1 hypothetical protein F1968_07645 [Avibacterium paragallinarum]RZN56886.1 hypothetical protein EIG78_08165 [Avibacterium paragallinarum]RZN73701.1 hypothetical protein EIG77_02210 [Avibacterium paragallinarum]SUV40903.1 Uncharacterised protein [Avibacterium paragallinarum]